MRALSLWRHFILLWHINNINNIQRNYVHTIWMNWYARARVCVICWRISCIALNSFALPSPMMMMMASWCSLNFYFHFSLFHLFLTTTTTSKHIHLKEKQRTHTRNNEQTFNFISREKIADHHRRTTHNRYIRFHFREMDLFTFCTLLFLFIHFFHAIFNSTWLLLSAIR